MPRQTKDTSKFKCQALVSLLYEHGDNYIRGFGYLVAKEIGVNRATLYLWAERGLPKAEYLPKKHPGRTNRSEVIAKLSKRKTTRRKLLTLSE